MTHPESPVLRADLETQIQQMARETAGKLADFAKAWYVGEADGKDDFRFIAHAIGDIAAALHAVAVLVAQQQADEIASLRSQLSEAVFNVNRNAANAVVACEQLRKEIVELRVAAALRAAAPETPTGEPT